MQTQTAVGESIWLFVGFTNVCIESDMLTFIQSLFFQKQVPAVKLS